MATLILTAVGHAIGGPIAGALGASVGGAIGALAGQAIDHSIFRPGGRSGPRLEDLRVQTSRYGAPIPCLFGTIRAAGTVIWSTDLRETGATSGGKGQPSITRYSYSASFAVALSARRILDVKRIWADGNLLRGSAGDFKSQLGAFRLHVGTADQLPDPLIAADVGIDRAPAYRDCAYAVFEDLQLEDFGNRIPSLTFEIVADDGQQGVVAIVSDLAGRAIGYAGQAEEPSVFGFGAAGADLRSAIDGLIDVHELQWRDHDGSIHLTSGIANDRALTAAMDIHLVDGEKEKPGGIRRAPIETVPRRLTIRHHDPERDFQIGSQASERPGPGFGADEVDLPAALAAAEARQLADRKLRGMVRGRDLATRALGWAALDLTIGDIVELEGAAGRWLVVAWEWADMAVRLTLRAIRTDARSVATAADPGDAVLQPDLVQGPTRLAIVEMPPDGTGLAAAPAVFIAATGADAGWRRAALFRYHSEPEAAEPIGRTAPRAVIGTTQTLLAQGQAWRFDRINAVDVLLHNAVDALLSTDGEALLAGANLCLVGSELLQFGRAEPIGERRYRLSHLVRGRYGTEWAAGLHATNEAFVMIDPARLARVEMVQDDIGQMLDVRGMGSGDTVPAEAALRIDGLAMIPPAPVHGRAMLSASGDVTLSWKRRSRLGWVWPSGSDVPLGEERETYVLRIMDGGTSLREWETAETAALYPAAEREADLIAAGGSPLRLDIAQRGTWGVSRPLSFVLP